MGRNKKQLNVIFELAILRLLKSNDMQKRFPNSQHIKYQSLGHILLTYIWFEMCGDGVLSTRQASSVHPSL